MSRIFLSHFSVDELEAVALQHWMAARGWDDVFLDIDSQRGLAASGRWKEALRRAADRCEAVVFIVTPERAKSKWCLAQRPPYRCPSGEGKSSCLRAGLLPWLKLDDPHFLPLEVIRTAPSLKAKRATS